MPEDWLTRWEEGRIGWHEAEGNSALRKFWPRLPAGSRVLVPLCGKSSDLLFLAREGCDVTGVELSDIAAKAFFEENELAYSSERHGGGAVYRSHELNLTVVCGDPLVLAQVL